RLECSTRRLNGRGRGGTQREEGRNFTTKARVNLPTICGRAVGFLAIVLGPTILRPSKSDVWQAVRLSQQGVRCSLHADRFAPVWGPRVWAVCRRCNESPLKALIQPMSCG